MLAVKRMPVIGTFLGVFALSAALVFALIAPARTGHAPAASAGVPASATVRAELELFVQADCDGAQCGLSGNGGEHFWVIASYAAVIKDAIIPRIEEACDTAGPGLGVACIVLGKALDQLVDHVSALTNHGVWGALYLTHRNVQVGKY